MTLGNRFKRTMPPDAPKLDPAKAGLGALGGVLRMLGVNVDAAQIAGFADMIKTALEQHAESVKRIEEALWRIELATATLRADLDLLATIVRVTAPDAAPMMAEAERYAHVADDSPEAALARQMMAHLSDTGPAVPQPLGEGEV